LKFYCQQLLYRKNIGSNKIGSLGILIGFFPTIAAEGGLIRSFVQNKKKGIPFFLSCWEEFLGVSQFIRISKGTIKT
jgi:hypothetical protein